MGEDEDFRCEYCGAVVEDRPGAIGVEFVTLEYDKDLDVVFCNWDHLSSWTAQGEPEFRDAIVLVEDDGGFIDYLLHDVFDDWLNVILFIIFIAWSVFAAFGVGALLDKL